MRITQQREAVAGQIAPHALLATLRAQFAETAAAFCVLQYDRLGREVYRLRFETDGTPRSVVVKRLERPIARRVELVAGRWLPAVGLEHAGPPLLAVAGEPDAQHVWHVYEDLDGCFLDERAPDVKGVAVTIEMIAQLHVRFADHPLLGECREWGGDAGMPFYRSSVRDAMRTVAELAPPAVRLTTDRLAVRDRILGHLNRLVDEEPWRADVLAEFAGPETLLHGDLWPQNVIVRSTAAGMRARFVDWDRVAVGPVTYDISAFLSRLPEGERAWIVNRYRRALARAGWRLPNASALDVLFTTAESARLANCAIWPPLAAMKGDADWEWVFEMLAALDGWFKALQDHGVRR
jgi:Phosphotransferase enzyme family